MLPSVRRHRELLVTYLSPQKFKVLVLTVVLLISIGLQLVNPQIVAFFVNTAQKGGPINSLTKAGIAFLVIALLQQAFTLVGAYLSQVVGWQATNSLRRDLLSHCLRLDLPFHKTHTPGELIERIDGDVTLLANFFAQFTVNVAANVLLVLGVIVILGATNIWLGLALGVYCVATFLVLTLLQRRAVHRQAADRQASAKQYGAIEERLTGTEDIRGVGAEGYVLSDLLRLLQIRLRANRTALLAGNMTFFAASFLYVIAFAVGLGFGAWLFLHHQIPLGTAYAITFYIGMLAGPLNAIRRQVQDMQRATAGISRIDTLLQTPIETIDQGRALLPAHAPTVTFDHVSFSYEVGDTILSDLSFELRSGRRLGLIGRTGSGKTSIARLLARLYDPTTGAIRLDGTDLRDVRLSNLRERIGVVTQEVQLFRATVRHNVTLFQADTPDAAILDVFRAIDLIDWCDRLPQGLDTIIGGTGGLSGGQAQLLALARLFLRDPGLVILDEASSRLDPTTERLVDRAMSRLIVGRTAILIAHRLQTIRAVDDVIVLDHGRVIEHGEREALLADPDSHLNALLQTAMQGAAA
jgi:ATP-binding cassette subfamily B protein